MGKKNPKEPATLQMIVNFAFATKIGETSTTMMMLFLFH